MTNHANKISQIRERPIAPSPLSGTRVNTTDLLGVLRSYPRTARLSTLELRALADLRDAINEILGE